MPELNQIQLPSNTYLVSEKNKQEKYERENHIIKTPSAVKSNANKLANDIFVYIPKGLKGSVNSNFHEFLSMGMIPYLTGSATMIALYNLANKFYDKNSIKYANTLGKKMALGVVLYGLGKCLGNKIIDTNTKLLTGVDSNLTYKKVIPSLPEADGRKPKDSIEFHKVYESVDFPRWDLLEAKSAHETGDKNTYYDKIAKKMGYKEKLNDSAQLVQGKIQHVLVKEKAAKNIVSYLYAAVGIAYATSFNTDLFNSLKNVNKENLKDYLKNNYKSLLGKFKDETINAGKKLWKNKTGKALLVTTAAATILGTLNSVIGFYKKGDTNKTQINKKKDYKEV